MTNIAYIQQANGDWLTENCYVAAKGFAALGFDIVRFELTNVPNMRVQKDDVVYGGINTTLALLDRMGFPRPELINAHRELPEFLGREVRETTVGALRQNEAGMYPMFIKPLEDNKLFDGAVVHSPIAVLLKLKQYADDVEIFASDFVTFAGEYRCFVNEGQLVGIQHYKGGYLDYIDTDVVLAAIQAYRTPPASYSLDFGITEKQLAVEKGDMPKPGKTLLIEINDGFGLGAYGLNGLTLAKMMLSRWRQLTTK